MSDTPDSPESGADTTPRDAALVSRLRDALTLLERVAADGRLLGHLDRDERRRMITAAGEVYAPDPAQRRRMSKERVKLRKQAVVARDEEALGQSGIRRLRRQNVFTTPDGVAPAGFLPEDLAPGHDDGPVREAEAGRNCYVCKRDYQVLHHFYDQLCPECAEFNFAKRGELADLSGRVALVTGGRVKIGYQACIKLLRCGAQVVVTTRFPRDAAARYAREADFAEWGHRLEVYGLDLRHTPSVEAFCHHFRHTHQRLDFVINNACQTVRRPPEYYAHMMAAEQSALDGAPEPVRRLLGGYEGLRGAELVQAGEDAAIAGLTRAAELSQLALLPGESAPRPDLFPEGRLDQDLQQVDLRDRNSWRLLLDEVPTVELLEVQLVNAVAPFVLNARLKSLMMSTPERDKHIVNVSAVEGQFYRKAKTTRHPHTNMAKAALNMMTRTSATDFVQSGIHMNAVDTGWVTDEDPLAVAQRKQQAHRFHPPLDIVDGAARIVDPIISGFRTGQHLWGQFLKDYRPTEW